MTKKALIEKTEYNYIIENGCRVAQVEDITFDVNTSKLEWVDCPDYVKSDVFIYDKVNKKFIPEPFSITEYTTNGNVITILSIGSGHNLQTGDVIKFRDADNNLLEGTHTVTVIDETHFTVPTFSYEVELSSVDTL